MWIIIAIIIIIILVVLFALPMMQQVIDQGQEVVNQVGDIIQDNIPIY